MNEEQMIEDCRADFGTFLTMDLALKKGDNYKPLAPFHYLVAKALQDFYDVLKTGGSPRLILSVPPRNLKLLANETLVPTPDGFKKHGDLKVGDVVFGRNGEQIKVQYVHPKDIADIKVTFSDGEEIVCNEEHLWTVYNRRKHKEETLKTKDLVNIVAEGMPGKRGCRYNYQIDRITTLNYNKKDLPIDPYLLGIWLGDGASSKGEICGSKKDFEEYGFEYSSRWIHKDTKVEYGIVKGLQTKLRENGLHKNKHIPEIYKHSSLEQRLSLLAGLIDSDGCFSDGKYIFVNKNKKLIDDVEELVKSLGCTSYLYKTKGGTSYHKEQKIISDGAYQLGFYLPHILPNKLIRKNNADSSFLSRKRSISKIEKIEAVEGNCITVEGGHYLVGKNQVLTHNSTICSIEFPAWILGREPDWTVNIATKDADLSTTFGGETKDTVSSDFYKMVFPDRNIRSDTKSKSDWAFETGGRYSISSVQAPPKGKGFNCLRGDTEVITNNGIKTIKDLYLSELQFGLKVLSYNHDKNTFEWKRIVATKRSTNITGKLTFSGKELFVTPEHNVWTREVGYTESQSISGLSGLSLKLPEMPDTLQEEKEGQVFMPELQYTPTEMPLRYRDTMQPLWKDFCESQRGIGEKIEGWTRETFLFTGMFWRRLLFNPLQKVQGLWRKNQELQQSVLSESQKGESSKGNNLSFLPEGSNQNLLQPEVLLNALQERASLSIYVKRAKSSLYRWATYWQEKLSKGVQGYPKASTQEGQESVYALSAESNSCSSYRQEYLQQPTHKFSDSLRDLSQLGTQTESPKLSFIFDPSQEAEYVYDIQVEDNHNFFANGLLVHNCIIIDDPYPGYVQAQSPAIQDMVWNTFKSDYEDRRSPNGTGIIIIMQRLGLNDLVAKIEEREEKLEEQGAVYHKYKKIIFPAIAEEDEYLTENGVKKVSELADLSGLDLFRKAGETLWEEGAPKKEILAMIGDDPVAFSSQYQQNPILSETQTYQANMVHFYDEDDKDIDFSKAKHYTFLDPSASKRKEADNSAIITIAVLDNKVYVRECFTAKFNSKVILQELFRQILKYDSKHGVEAQASQVLWSTLIRDYAIENQIKVRHNEDNEYRVHTQKEARIRTHLDNYILNGRLYLKKHMTSLLREICDFPRGRRDDQIDALAAAVSMIESKKTTKDSQVKKISRQALSMISGMR